MTTQTLRKDDGHARRNSQTTPAERTAIRAAPELKDNDSRNAFIRHLAHRELQTGTLSTVQNSHYTPRPIYPPSSMRLEIGAYASIRRSRRKGQLRRMSSRAFRSTSPIRI